MDEIWNLIDSLVFDEETLTAMKQEEEKKRLAKKAAKAGKNGKEDDASKKKERWKKTGKPVAKKTIERRKKAKSKNRK